MAARSLSLLIEKPLFASSPVPSPNHDELAQIYTAHHREVLRVCRRFFRQREDAEDAAAEIFLKLHRVLDKRDPSMPFRPWLAQVANRHCIDKLRQKKRESNWCLDGVDVTEMTDGSAVSPLGRLLVQEKQSRVREQMNRLPERYRLLLILRYYKSMSYAEIAGALNRQLPAVRMMIFRAKDQLRRNLQLLGGSDAASELQ